MAGAEAENMEEAAVQVLFVDDEENILKSIRRLLADEPYEVLTATSGERGLEILRGSDNVGLIVTDQRMPGLTGVEFLKQALEIAPDAPRILLTGYADITATIDAINKGGAHRYISKPWNDEELILIIREAVGRYNLTVENKRLWGIVNKQNQELQEWNTNLKARVLEQTASIRNAMKELHGLNEKLHNNYESCLVAFSGLLELRDRETSGHCRNVAHVSVTVARKMGLSAEETENIRVAALLHDIGKIGISDSLLRGDMENMNEEQLKEYRVHPVRGQAALDSIEDLRPAGVLIRSHHEAFDGSGFPDGLAGGDIPLGARIISVADAIDRRFRADDADVDANLLFRNVRQYQGSRFDPSLFPFFEKVVLENYGYGIRTGEMIEMELFPSELRTGMLVAREVRSGTGLLLLAKGERLDEGKIHSLRRYYLIDPPTAGVLVLTRR